VEHFPRQYKAFIGRQQTLCIGGNNLDFSLQAGIAVALSILPHVVPVFPERNFVQ
jgi:hypothetical protein